VPCQRERRVVRRHALLIVLANVVADAFQARLDPRVRLRGA
jgi:ABC-type dipeptide/oligopeptide/nickel transport system permease component